MHSGGSDDRAGAQSPSVFIRYTSLYRGISMQQPQSVYQQQAPDRKGRSPQEMLTLHKTNNWLHCRHGLEQNL